MLNMSRLSPGYCGYIHNEELVHMAILVKVKDSTNDRTDFTYIRNDKVNEFDKSDYILQEITPEDDKFIQFIYPGHTETFTQFKINYTRGR